MHYDYNPKTGVNVESEHVTALEKAPEEMFWFWAFFKFHFDR